MINKMQLFPTKHIHMTVFPVAVHSYVYILELYCSNIYVRNNDLAIENSKQSFKHFNFLILQCHESGKLHKAFKF